MVDVNEIEFVIDKVNGIKTPTFNLHTDSFNETYDYLKLFCITPLTLNLDAIRITNTNTTVPLPSGKALRFEIAYEDPFPFNAFECYLTRSEMKKLKKTNQSSKKIQFYLVGRDDALGTTKKVLLQDLYPYIVDWQGMTGLSVMKRLSSNFDSDKIDRFIQLLELHIEECGYLTGVFTELGYLYYMKKEYKQAIKYYTNEVEALLSLNTIPTLSLIKTLNNIGVVLRSINETEKAYGFYQLALNINCNFFEAYLNISALIKNDDLLIKCISRAYKIRPDDEALPIIIQNIAKRLSVEENELKSKIQGIASNIDLNEKFEEFIISEPFDEFLKKILLSI